MAKKKKVAPSADAGDMAAAARPVFTEPVTRLSEWPKPLTRRMNQDDPDDEAPDDSDPPTE